MMRKRAVAILLLLLFVILSRGETTAGSDFTLIKTGIQGGVCWYDDSHFVVIKRQQSAPGHEFEMEGLYYLDPHKPKDLRRIDLSPIEPNFQKRIHAVSCQEQTILFYLRSDEPGLQQLYSLKIGSRPELIAEMRGGVVQLRGGYVISRFRRPGSVEDQGFQGIGIYEAHPDCGVKYVRPGLKALCVDTWMETGWWNGAQYRVVEYTWYEIIKVRDNTGKEKWAPNPEPPLKLADGTELKHGYLLRDLENRVVQQVKLEQPPYQIYRIPLKLDPQGEYLYANCSKAGDHGDKHYTEGGRVCRFKLDGNNRAWEEVFAVQQSPKDPFGLQDIDVNAQGDVVVIDRGHSLNQSIWRYTASSRTVEFVTRAPLDLGGPLLSPDGRWVSFALRNEWHFAHHKDKGARP